MSRTRFVVSAGLLAASLLLGIWSPVQLSPVLGAPPKTAFTFRDVGHEAGLFPEVAGIEGHAAGWGDIDGDGWLDLYVATFHRPVSKPNMLFRNKNGKFVLDDQPQLRITTRATAGLFADLDNDGDLELYVSSMPQVKNNVRGCSLFRNDGQGKYTDISEDNGACPAGFGGRSATVLDYDGDGLLDLLVGEDPVPGYNGSKTKSFRLFRNQGGLKFADVSREVGIPEDVPGLGVAAGDVNNDGWPDFFVASHKGGNLLFLNDGKGHFRVAPGAKELFHWPDSTGDNMICGVVLQDTNGDGLLDVLLGQHYSSPWIKPVPSRLYINRGIKNGDPTFEDVTEAVGLIPLPLKAPHVEIQDFDNDGLPDISASMIKFAEGKPHPVIYKNLGLKNGLPQYRTDVLSVNDFPNETDLAVKGTGPFFKKMVEDKKVVYMAPGPTADFDNDGRLDMFLPNWWIDLPSLLLRNETPSGNWLQIQVEAGKGVNRMGIGSRVNIYQAGKLGDKKALLGGQEMSVGYGYASAQPAILHFGLAKTDKVDIEVILPHGKGRLEKKDVTANQRLTVK